MFKKLKIGQKLVLTFLLVAMLSSIPGVVSVFLLKSADIDYSDALINYGFSQGDVGMLMNSFSDNVSALMQMIATDNTALLQDAQARITKNNAQIDTYMAAIAPTLTDAEEQGYYDTIQENLPELIEHAKEIAQLASAGRKLEAMNLFTTEASEHLEAITAAVQNLMDANRNTGTELSTRLTNTSNITLIIMIIAILVFIVLSIIIAIAMSLSVSKPMGECAQRIVQLSEGDLTSPIPTVKSEDETGVLAQATAVLVERLSLVISEMCDTLGALAVGNFTVTLKQAYNGDFAPLQSSTTQIIESLNATLSQIAQSADQVAGGSDQVAGGAQALSQGATEQASSVEELAATINEISHQITQNAGDAADARQKANSAGGEMTASNHQMDALTAAMGRISESSGEIGKIIKTIEDIAFQTNILALNAAVEAARAGAAGKGFAVVADEVRNLATKSQEASKNTAALIENSIRAVEEGTKIAGETAQSLLHAVEGVDDVVKTVDRISNASSQQAAAITQVTQGIDQISSVVQTNSATAEQSAAASEELSSQAQIMKGLLDRFRLSQDAPVLPAEVSPAHSTSHSASHTAPRSSALDKY